jgi:hypothetical protein
VGVEMSRSPEVSFRLSQNSANFHCEWFSNNPVKAKSQTKSSKYKPR